MECLGASSGLASCRSPGRPMSGQESRPQEGMESSIIDTAQDSWCVPKGTSSSGSCRADVMNIISVLLGKGSKWLCLLLRLFHVPSDDGHGAWG